MKDNEPVFEGKQRIERWQVAQESLRRAIDAVNRADCELLNATNDLGEWMCPSDAQTEEVFCIWWGDSLIQVKKTGQNSYECKTRLRGKRGLQP